MSGERQQAELEEQDTSVLMALTTPNGRLLEEVARCSKAQVDFRGNKILVSGEQASVELARRFLVDAVEMLTRGVPVGPQDVASIPERHVGAFHHGISLERILPPPASDSPRAI